MTDIPLPRLLNSSGVFIRRIRPLKVSIEESIVPLSSASIQLPEDESLPARYYMELFTPIGSAGIYRIRSPQNAYGEDISVAELEHAIVEVGDYLVREKISAMMTPQAALQRIFTNHYRGSRWQLSGNLSALGNTQVAVRVNYDNILTAILSIIEQIPSCYMTFDFSTSPRWTVGFASRGTTVSAEGRLSRNVQSAKITYDDSELCTKAYYEVEITNASGEPDTEWRSLESDYMGRYGTVEREVSISAGATEAEALKTVQGYLRKHETPRVSIEIGGQELSHITGEQLDTFRIGKLFRLAMVDYDLTVEDVITGLIWDDVYRKPTEVTVRLADEEDTAVSYIHDIDVKGGRSGGGGGSRKQQEDAWKEYYTDIQKTDHYVDIYARHVDRNNSILNQAGMYLDANGVLLYAESNLNNIGYKIKPANIWVGIDDYLHQSVVKISADIIDMDGVVQNLEAYNIECGDIACGALTPQSIDCENVVSGAGIIADEYLQVGEEELFVADISISGNVLTVRYVDGTEQTFSKATTLTGGWSGGVFTVTAKQNGATVGTDLTSLAGVSGHWGQATGDTSEDVNKYYGEIKATHNSAPALLGTGKSITIDAISRYNAGYTDGAASVPQYSHSATLTRYRAGPVEGAIPGRMYRLNSNGTYTALGTSSSYWYEVNSVDMGSTKTVHYN